MTEQAQETERKLGRYTIIERTARLLVIESRRRPLLTVALVWAIFLPIVAAIGPWMGGTRIFIAGAAALTLVVVTLMVILFTPTRRRIEIDLDAGNFRLGRTYLVPWQGQVAEVPVRSVTAIRRKRYRWGVPGEARRTEWSVELVDEGGRTWSLAERAGEQPAAELARLVAEVAGCPMEEGS